MEQGEMDAYKQLLQITQNLLNELSPQQQILHKYYTLKKSILAKAKSTNISNSNLTAISMPYSKILHTYKTITKNMIQCLTQFEAQIEGEMDKVTFLKSTSRLIKDIDKQIKSVNQQFSSYFVQNESSSRNTKSIFKQQLNAVKFITKEMEGKIQNMGLMIQVHRKMHEIILEASQKQAKTTQKQIQYNKRLNQMENVVQQVSNVNKYIQSYKITQSKTRKFQLARKNLAKVLFDL